MNGSLIPYLLATAIMAPIRGKMIKYFSNAGMPKPFLLFMDMSIPETTKMAITNKAITRNLDNPLIFHQILLFVKSYSIQRYHKEFDNVCSRYNKNLHPAIRYNLFFTFALLCLSVQKYTMPCLLLDFCKTCKCNFILSSHIRILIPRLLTKQTSLRKNSHQHDMRPYTHSFSACTQRDEASKEAKTCKILQTVFQNITVR